MITDWYEVNFFNLKSLYVRNLGKEKVDIQYSFYKFKMPLKLKDPDSPVSDRRNWLKVVLWCWLMLIPCDILVNALCICSCNLGPTFDDYCKQSIQVFLINFLLTELTSIFF